MPVMDMASVSVTGLDVSDYQVNTCSAVSFYSNYPLTLIIDPLIL